MAHLVGPDCTGAPATAHHVGVNARVVSYTLAGTASGSNTIAIAALPGGARVLGATLSFDNNAVALGAAPGEVSLEDGFGNVYITSASGNKAVHVWSPTHDANGVRLTSSSNLIVRFNQGLPGSGTATTVISVAFQYLAQDDPD